jgi:outer membrane protein assembly factor BamB
VNPGHSSYQPDDGLVPPLQKAWSHAFDGHVSYPLIAKGRVFVTIPNASFVGRRIYALSAADGSVLWGPVAIGGTYARAWLTYDNDTVFAINLNGDMMALDAATGTARWSKNIGAGATSFGIPVALGGAVYAQASNDFFAVDQGDGHTLWTIFTNTAGPPAVSDSSIFLAWGCGEARRYDRLTGKRVWTHPSSGCSGSGAVPALADGRVFVSGTTPEVLDALYGLDLGTPQFSLPSVHGDRMVNAVGSVTARDVRSGNTLWTFAGDASKMWQVPLLVNGYVYVGSTATAGNLWALDEATGQSVWTTSVGAPIGLAPGSTPDDDTMAAGEGLLLVPAGNSLTAFKSVTAPTKTCPTPPACAATNTCGKDIGAPCATAQDCASGFCADGYCCGAACDGSCRSCAQPGEEGRCLPVAIGPDAPSCSACQDGACPYPKGQKCSAPSECANGNCVDGYCCTKSSCGGCGACNLPGAEGTCMAIPGGQDPRGTCQTTACLFYPEGCGRGESCDGEWTCNGPPIPCPGMYSCSGTGDTEVCGTGCGSNAGCCSWGTSPVPFCLTSANVFLACGAHANGNTVNWTQNMTSQLSSSSCTMTADSNYNGPWSGGRGEYTYQFKADATENVQISVKPTAAADDIDFWVFPAVDPCPNGGCCSQYKNCRGVAHMAPGGMETLTVPVTAGTTYFIFIDTRHTNEAAGALGAAFTIDVACGVP